MDILTNFQHNRRFAAIHLLWYKQSRTTVSLVLDDTPTTSSQKKPDLSCRGVRHQLRVTAAVTQAANGRRPQPKSEPCHGYCPSARPPLSAPKPFRRPHQQVERPKSASPPHPDSSSGTVSQLRESVYQLTAAMTDHHTQQPNRQLSSAPRVLLHFLFGVIKTQPFSAQ